jgi:hypothetical protein
MVLRGGVVLLVTAALGLAAPATARPGHAPQAPMLGAFARTLTMGAWAAPTGSRAVDVSGHVNPGEDATGQIWVNRGHAYLASFATLRSSCGSGVRVYDLRNPRSPRRVSAFARADSDPALGGTYPDQARVRSARTPFFRGDLAAVGLQRCREPFDGRGGTRGFALYDVTRPATPRLLSIVNTLPVNGSHELWLQTVGNRAYVYTAIPRAELAGSPNGVVPGNPDFRIYDVSNPRQPVQVGQWGIWANLGIKPPRNQFVHSVITNQAATRAYLSYWEFGTVILDISNPTTPSLVAQVRDPGQVEPPHAHSAALAARGRVLIETHEFGRFFNFTGTGYPRFYDLSDERNPKLIGRFEPPGTESSTVHDPRVVGTRAYISWYDHGIVVLDISNPRAPRELAQFAPGGGRNSGNPYCSGCPFVWGVFPYLDYMVASDMNTGLWVLKLRCVVPRVRGLALPAARAALARADCRTGKVRRVAASRSRRGRVVSQRPGPGAKPSFPAAVRLTVGR